jgi:conjugal transfer pilus assembly protein TraB
MKESAKKIGAKQKKFFYGVVGGFVAVAALLVSFTGNDKPSSKKQEAQPSDAPLDTVSQEVDPEAVRLSFLEQMNDSLNERLQTLEDSLKEVHSEKLSYEEQNRQLSDQTRSLMEKLESREEKQAVLPEKKPAALKSWDRSGKKEERHVSFEIPAGTVLKAVLVSGADCSVAVHKPTGPNMVLLRPLDNGQLPRNVRVPLKGSVIVGNAIGDISSERVYIRAERLTLVEKNGSFAETEVSAYVSGEDGREGMRGVVVDRSGQIVTRAAFAAILQGVGLGLEASISNHLIDQHSKKGNIILSPDFIRPAQQGSSTALGKLTDYYIKRAEQLQPAIQVAAGRVVDVVFTKSVKIGEKDLKKKFEMQRAAKKND